MENIKYMIQTYFIFIIKINLLSYQDNSLLKEIVKNIKKTKIEISDKLIFKKKENIKYFCKCRNGANYICDKCDEFLCEFCYKKKKTYFSFK